VTVRGQALGQAAADESGRAGDEGFQRRSMGAR
jgi:hypothetical protein